jgi:hypothetical protein
LSWLLITPKEALELQQAESFKLNELHSVKEVKSFSTKLQIDHIWRPGNRNQHHDDKASSSTRFCRRRRRLVLYFVWRT